MTTRTCTATINFEFELDGIPVSAQTKVSKLLLLDITDPQARPGFWMIVIVICEKRERENLGRLPLCLAVFWTPQKLGCVCERLECSRLFIIATSEGGMMDRRHTVDLS